MLALVRSRWPLASRLLEEIAGARFGAEIIVDGAFICLCEMTGRLHEMEGPARGIGDGYGTLQRRSGAVTAVIGDQDSAVHRVEHASPAKWSSPAWHLPEHAAAREGPGCAGATVAPPALDQSAIIRT